ncbi:MAG TPA: hypothetical protein VF692_09320 [Pyrinomonadaceae bacterium]|jgi:glycosidase
MFRWTQKWIQLRRENIALRKGKTVDLYYDEDLYVFERNHQLVDRTATTLVAFNKSDKTKEISLNYKVSKTMALENVSLKPLLGDSEEVTINENKVIFKLLPGSAVVYGILP